MTIQLENGEYKSEDQLDLSLALPAEEFKSVLKSVMLQSLTSVFDRAFDDLDEQKRLADAKKSPGKSPADKVESDEAKTD